MTNSSPLRFTCVWEDHLAGPTPQDWMSTVAHANGLGADQLQLNSSAGFAGLRHHSLLIPSARSTTRDERADWVRAIEADLGLDYLAVVATTGEMALQGPALVVMDADSTLFTGEGIDMIAEKAGTQDEVAAITASAMRGELDFAESLRARMGTLAGLSVSVLDEVREVYDFSPGAADMVEAFHRYGIKIGVVSGGFMEIVEPKAKSIGIDYVLANRFEIEDGRLTGRPLGEIVTGESKEAALVRWADELGVSTDLCVAMGDGANDIKMIRRAGIGIAYMAKPALREAADARIPFPNLAAGADLTGPTSTLINR
ncbi:MAG: phosphoserine phosphatase SerB [Mobiluncus porci]|uniref:phosphoserine phosphatase n=2 Tax=Mobiluncus porci TaxID=2652278 RepID=A0A7K0K023_9ACTO|nr:phosphoserine phosphatase SerB [Mobiluncus porci]MDD7541506.1 phosphoserine phosphatase SerB [Mobiluncus porci]MDY5748491.1 phosphoserine phosphatase SerB [Mobiluncus porci]MST48749.1 phosphoserine phosphatase SerB [Mobiluncus porci]